MAAQKAGRDDRHYHGKCMQIRAAVSPPDVNQANGVIPISVEARAGYPRA